MSIFPTKILLATDGSSEAQLAARTALELTQKTDSELHAIHVVDFASSIALLYPEAVGYERTANFASPGGAVLDEPRLYDAPTRLRLNHWALSGDWTVERQATVLNEANGRIAYRFHTRDLHLVMGPAARGTSVRFRVLLDGQPPGAAHGIDVDDQGNGTVTEQRMYQLIRQPKPIADRQFEIEFLDSGVEAYCFTFG